MPRLAAIEYPLNRTLGKPGDSAGQMAVLRSVLEALAEIDSPGGTVHLPFEWPETPDEVRAFRFDPPPIADYLRKHPMDLRRLISRRVPN